MVRISRRSIGPVRIQYIICLEDVYPFDTYILLNKYVLNISVPVSSNRIITDLYAVPDTTTAV